LFCNVYPLDGNLLAGEHYPAFEQLGSGKPINIHPPKSGQLVLAKSGHFDFML